MFQTTSSHLVCEAKRSSTPSVSVFEGGLGVWTNKIHVHLGIDEPYP